MRLLGFDEFLPIIWKLGPWSGDILIYGKPKVIFIASKPLIALIGDKTWSWYIPIITSNFFLFWFKNIVSAEKGPLIFNFFFLSNSNAGEIIFLSSLILKKFSQWGFNPQTAIEGFFEKNLL